MARSKKIDLSKCSTGFLERLYRSELPNLDRTQIEKILAKRPPSWKTTEVCHRHKTPLLKDKIGNEYCLQCKKAMSQAGLDKQDTIN